MAEEVTLTEENFEEEVLKTGLPVLVDFWAEWCGPCKTMAPVIDELAGEFKDRVKVAKVNVDQCPGLAEKYGIRGIPTIIVFYGGEIEDQLVGVQTKDVLKGKLENFLDQNVF